jgi:hypothetical protein
MTRKDYELMVAALTAVRAESSSDSVSYEGICRQLTTVLQRDNPRFNRDRFLAACGVSIDTQEV